MIWPAPVVAPTVHIDVWSDVICPWCFLGKRRLERAIEVAGLSDAVTVRWRAYQLDPRASAEPGDLRAAIERKYGPGAFDGMTRRLTALGTPEGIDYRFDLAQRVGTIDAHRLLAWAWEAGGAPAQGALAERLFVAYFTEGANVADPDELVRLADEVGLAAGAARDVLASTAFADAVAEDIAIAGDLQITGVPAFVVAERLLIPGAQEVETFVALLTRAAERFGRLPGPDGTEVDVGAACAVDDPRC